MVGHNWKGIFLLWIFRQNFNWKKFENLMKSEKNNFAFQILSQLIWLMNSKLFLFLSSRFFAAETSHWNSLTQNHIMGHSHNTWHFFVDFKSPTSAHDILWHFVISLPLLVVWHLIMLVRMNKNGSGILYFLAFHV